MGFLDRFRSKAPPPEPEPALPAAPTAKDIQTALGEVETMVAEGSVPAVVRARTLRVTDLIQKALPRLEHLGLGSYDAYSVIATATDYLPEAVGAYLRLPRDWADTRPVQGGKTALLLLIDQLDLLGSTMEKIYDAANRTDAQALIAHGQFLQEKFGQPPPAMQITVNP
ncbi:MAG: hypothetical protein FWG47_06400 [Propionibacteriaceae bacterium]|nr:hypothetical protein [Propionibacteriaceae bacterium]